MKRPICMAAAVLVLLAVAAAGPAWPEAQCEPADQPPPVGGVFPDISLSTPEDAAAREYLNLDEGGTFKPSALKTDVVIIEIFSMYCPYCQREAPAVNTLYELIQGREDLKGKIKIIGIGAGNSPFEVEHFKTTYHVPFPAFNDEDYSIHKALGQVRTPYFIGLRIHPDGTHKVFLSQLGSIGDPKEFLDRVVQSSSIQAGGS